jgi:7-cyano-7-deazaguanine synthase
MKPKAVVLLSGGIDSTIILHLAKKKGFDTHCLIVNYGQRNTVELDRAKRIAEESKSSYSLVTVDFGGMLDVPLINTEKSLDVNRKMVEIGDRVGNAYVPARNLILCALAVSYAEAIGAFDIFIGVYNLSEYPDSSEKFCAAVERAAQKATIAGRSGKKFKVHSFTNKNKYEAIARAVDEGIDLSLTMSCFSPVNGRPCGICDACVTRRHCFDAAGCDDPAELGKHEET